MYHINQIKWLIKQAEELKTMLKNMEYTTFQERKVTEYYAMINKLDFTKQRIKENKLHDDN